MNFWFLGDRERMLAEVNAVKRLAEGEEWLTETSWHATDGRLNCDAVITAHGHAYPVRLSYPDYFPDLAPWVVPIDDDRRWSGHQFGRGGVLCLEVRPDNWEPHRLGAELLASACRLLSTENPLGDPSIDGQEVESGHVTTLVEDLRHQRINDKPMLFISAGIRDKLSSMDAGATFSTTTVTSASRLNILQSVDDWSDDSVPDPGRSPGWRTTPGIALRSEGNAVFARLDKARKNNVIFVPSRDVFLSSVESEPGQPPAEPEVLWFVPDNRAEKRLDQELRAAQRVGIVGLGSLGSKVAMSLARSGVRDFVLIDSDVLLPGNLVRHALDWRYVGADKVKGMAAAILEVQPGAEIDTRSIEIAGQGSTRSHAHAIETLGTCSLIIEATTEGQVFNLLSAISRRARIPLLWGMVYGGGLGGFVARSRPGVDVSPQQMRSAYHNFCHENPPESEQHPATPYEAPSPGGGPPLTASDADVAVIAHHMAQMALDLLSEREGTNFPHSMYLIGFRKGWVFEQPFHTLPLKLPEPEDAPGKPVGLTPEESAQAEAILASLLKPQST